MGTVSVAVVEMTWSFAVRPNDADDYLFSFAGITTSNLRAGSHDEVAVQLIENSVTALLDEWAKSDTFAKLRAWHEDAPPPERPATEPESAVQ